MKKLYRKSTVHPTPSDVSDHLLSFLPAAILSLTAALSPADREVLAYLISCSSVNFSSSQRKTAPKAAAAAAGSSKGFGGVGGGGAADHAACFNCSCFRCYMSYWAKWDSSPNRQLIHEVIDAFEETLLKESKREKNRREKRKGKSVKGSILTEPKCSDVGLGEANAAAEGGGERAEVEGGDAAAAEEFEKGSVRRFVGFLGERIWSVWG